MSPNRRLIAVDSETDPATYGRIPQPFAWGAYDGNNYEEFLGDDCTQRFLEWLQMQRAIAYAHNGGKFDFMFLVPLLIRYLKDGKIKGQVINGRVVKMKIGNCELRDSFAAIPAPLRVFGGKGEIDYRKLEANVRHKYMDEIRTYMYGDCVSLHEVMTEYRQIAGTKTTIASNALAFAKTVGCDYGKTNHTFDKKLRRFFFGGHCELFKPGRHKNVRMADIRSAYPYAMLHDHPSGSAFRHIEASEFYMLTQQERQRSFIHLSCNAEGCFPFRTKTGLEFPCRYDEYFITGWEFEAAADLGLIDRITFHDIIILEGKQNFAPYINHWYEYKSRWNKDDNPIQYEIGKRMQTAYYGKAAQNPTRYFDYEWHPAGTPICHEFNNEGTTRAELCNCGKEAKDHGWERTVEYGDIQIHRRSSIWRYQYRFGKEWEGHPIYNNVATGASITGFTRAHLLRSMYKVGKEHVIYCDTDSLLCTEDADISALPMSKNLGDWADEGIGEVGLFTGKKQYAIRLTDICHKFQPDDERICLGCHHPEKGHGSAHKVKMATKGAKLYFKDIENLLSGGVVVWKSKFPSFSLAGGADFVVRNISSTAMKKEFPDGRRKGQKDRQQDAARAFHFGG